MNASQRAEWAAIREEERENRIARKIAQGDALDPALVEGARHVHAALERECFWVSLGFGPSRHIVTVRSVKSDVKARVESISNKALKGTSRYPDVIAFGSFMRIEVREGRAAWEMERICERGDGGVILYPNVQGVLVPVGNPEPCKPVSVSGYEAA